MICLDLDEEARYISKRTGCSLDIATTFVDLEDSYYDLLGVNVYDDSPVKEISQEDATVVDEDELLKFICSKSEEISENLCETMLEAEHEYFVKIGIVEEF